MTEPPPIDVPAWCRQLAVLKQAALTLHLDGEQLTALLLQGTGCRVATKHLSANVLATLARLQQLATMVPDDGPLLDEAAAALALSDVLPAELISEALVAGSLLVAPHGSMHLLPWPMLQVDGVPAFERLAIGVAPNLAGLANARATVPPLGVVAVGVSSERHADIDAEAECRAVAQRHSAADLTADATLVGAAATRSALLALLQRLPPFALTHSTPESGR